MVIVMVVLLLLLLLQSTVVVTMTGKVGSGVSQPPRCSTCIHVLHNAMFWTQKY